MANYTPSVDNGIQNIKVVCSFIPVVPTPVIITGFASNTIITLNSLTQNNVQIGADGFITSSIMPVLVTGSLDLKFQSIGASVLRTVQQAQSSTGISYPGTMVLTKLGLLPISITYNNFQLTDAFIGLSTNDNNISDVTFNFTASLPDSNILSDLTNLAALGISLANGIL